MKLLHITFLFFLHCFVVPAYTQQAVILSSHSKHLKVSLFIQNDQLHYSVTAGNQLIIEPSVMGIRVNNIVYGNGIKRIALKKKYSLNTYFKTRGNSATARNYCNVYNIKISGADQYFDLEFRVFNNGCAFRYILPGDDEKTVNTEQTSFKIPADSRVWFFERDSDWKLKSYAGWWKSTAIDSLPVISKQGPVQGKPLVIQLANKKYIVLTEAALKNYSGLRYRAIGNRTMQADFTEGEKGFRVKGICVTPWRVVLYAADLNSLVNNQVITCLNPQPDKKLFNDMSYIREGKAVWSWITRKENFMQPDEEKRFIDAASTLQFQYTMIDEGWETIWPRKWEQLEEICRYAALKNIRVWVWKDSKYLRDSIYRDAFLDSIARAGVAGIKIDFMNSEAKDLVDFETGFLAATARRKLMVNFHGCQAPTGESITYPNEMTREGIRGMELNIMKEPIPAWHNAALPFTRFLCGHGDYTPGLFTRKGNTTYTHQLALLYLFNSPFQSIAENPVTLLTDKLFAPIIPLLKTLPVTWDETIVLEGSEIGKIAALAKRKGTDWYIAVINGTGSTQDFCLNPAFLTASKKYRTTIISEAPADAGFVISKEPVSRSQNKKFILSPTGGLVIEFKED